jgi:uncharacterized membrane protein
MAADIIFPFRNPGLKILAHLVKATAANASPPFSFKALPRQRPAGKSELELVTYYPAALAETYSRWTACPHFPRFMRAVRTSCQPEDSDDTWRLRLREEEVPWKAITIEKRPCCHISWWSIGGGSHRNRGSVSFGSGGWRTTKIALKVEFYESSAWAVTEATMKTLRNELERALDLLHASAGAGPRLGPEGVPL